MARIRTIKPIHWSDKELSKITLPAHLLWIATWNFSDDEGVIENDPLLLKSQIFPRRTDIRTEQVKEWIDQLVKARFMIPFTHDGEGYLLHRTFKIHQKIDKPQPSKIPSEVIRRAFDECSQNVQPCIVEESNVKEGSISSPIGANISEYKKLDKSKKSIYEFIRNKSPGFIEPYRDFWNLFAGEKGMPEVKTINEKRRKKLLLRVREKSFDFPEILRKAGKSEFILNGKWFGFDWIIENDSNYLKVIEGSYDKKEEKTNNTFNENLKSAIKNGNSEAKQR